MPRYIDAEALLQLLPDDLPYKASVKRVLTQAPTATVSVVLGKKVIDRIRKETAEEIMAELVKAGIHEFRYPVIAEIKKKYTEV